MADYIPFIAVKSERTATTFLNMKALGDELINEVFSIPRWVATLTKWGVAVAVVGALIAIFAIFVPIAWDAHKDWRTNDLRVTRLEQQVRDLQASGQVKTSAVESSAPAPSDQTPATNKTASK